MLSKENKKIPIPFYMCTKFQKKSMFPLKTIISSYLYKPQIQTPSSQKLNETFTNLYRLSRSAHGKRIKRVKTKTSQSILSKNINLKEPKKDAWLSRQLKYEALFCGPKWDTQNWSIFRSTLNNVPDSSIKINRACKNSTIKNKHKESIAKRSIKSAEGAYKLETSSKSNNFQFTWYSNKASKNLHKIRCKIFV